MNNPNFSIDPSIQRAAELANIEVTKNYQKANSLAEIEIRKKERLEETKFNFEVKKSTKINDLEVTEDGHWQVVAKLYDDSEFHYRFTNLKDLTAYFLIPKGIDKYEDNYFLVFRVNDDERLCELFIRRDDLTPNKLRKKLVQRGVKFNVKGALMTELFDRFIAHIVEKAEASIQGIPTRNGWYCDGKRYHYAKKESYTWRTVMENV